MKQNEPFLNSTKCLKLSTDLFLIKKQYDVQKSGNGMDITGPYWMLIKIKLIAGQISWKMGNEFYLPEKKEMWIYVPSYSWTSEFYSSKTKVKLQGVFSKTKAKSSWPQIPVLFYLESKMPQSINDVSDIFNKKLIYKEISLNSNSSGAALKVKNLLDNTFDKDISMEDLSIKLKASSAVVSRQFKSSYGFTPMQYKRGLRITTAIYELLSGQKPTEAASRAGYNDLGRFYKQFKQYMKETPESHRIKKVKKRQDLKNNLK